MLESIDFSTLFLHILERINNTWNIPFFTFKEQKNCQLTFIKKLFASIIEHKLHEKSDFINLPKY